MILDTHVHVVGETKLEETQASVGYQHHTVTAQDIFSQWDSAGISRGILSQPSFLGKDNSSLISALDEGRFNGVISVDWAEFTDEKAAEWDKAGVRGVRLNYFRSPPSEWPDLDSETSKKVFDILRNRGWHVEVYARAAFLKKLLPTLVGANVLVCIDHFGMPDNRPSAEECEEGFEALLEVGRSGNTKVHVMLSADYRFSDDAQYVREHAQRLFAAFGPHRLFWASDFPFTRYEEQGLTVAGQLEKLKDWLPEDAQPQARQQILWDTPLAFFKPSHV